VTAKGFQPARPHLKQFKPYLTFSCTYQNASGSDIRAFTGAIAFQDLFGREVYRISITISDPIKAGQRANWNGTVHFNQFLAPQVRFRDTKLTDMRASWIPVSIILADGTQLGARLGN
jgi:hypothetical protein